MKILSENFIKSFSKPILNIHPSLLPSFRGLNTYQRALDAGCLIHGATVHQLTKEVDQGPILGQVIIKIAENSTAKKIEEAKFFRSLANKANFQNQQEFNLEDYNSKTLPWKLSDTNAKGSDMEDYFKGFRI